MSFERAVALEVKAATRQQIIEKALSGKPGWAQAARALLSSKRSASSGR
jgi:hypothetical protein